MIFSIGLIVSYDIFLATIFDVTLYSVDRLYNFRVAIARTFCHI